jgi:hypothetical protein
MDFNFDLATDVAATDVEFTGQNSGQRWQPLNRWSLRTITNSHGHSFRFPSVGMRSAERTFF